jgi:hypothetical protein
VGLPICPIIYHPGSAIRRPHRRIKPNLGSIAGQKGPRTYKQFVKTYAKTYYFDPHGIRDVEIARAKPGSGQWHTIDCRDELWSWLDGVRPGECQEQVWAAQVGNA